MPLIWRGCLRFRADKALYPLIVWAALALVLGSAQFMWPVRSDRWVTDRIDEMTREASFSDYGRQDALPHDRVAQRRDAR